MEVCILNTKNLMMAQVAVSKLESQGIFCDYSILDYSLVLRSDPCFNLSFKFSNKKSMLFPIILMKAFSFDDNMQ